MICDKKNCTGCFACYNICPKEAIVMKKDEYGNVYPEIIKEKCIDCGLCKKVCPQLKEKLDLKEPITAYAMYNKDSKKRSESASGGAASTFYEHILNKKGVIYGASNLFGKEEFSFIRIEDKKDLYKVKGSKYVHCYINDILIQVKKDLLDNRDVIFIGTPCQVSGLKSFLMKEYDNLITVDIVCHGVPSQDLFDKAIESYERKNNCKIEEKDGEYILTSTTEKDFGGYKAVAKVVIGTDGIVSIYHDDELAHQFMPDKTDKKYDITQKMIDLDNAANKKQEQHPQTPEAAANIPPIEGNGIPKSYDTIVAELYEAYAQPEKLEDGTLIFSRKDANGNLIKVAEVIQTDDYRKIISFNEANNSITITKYNKDGRIFVNTGNKDSYCAKNKILTSFKAEEYEIFSDNSYSKFIKNENNEESFEMYDANHNKTESYKIISGESNIKIEKYDSNNKLLSSEEYTFKPYNPDESDLATYCCLEEESKNKFLEKLPTKLLEILPSEYRIEGCVAGLSLCTPDIEITVLYNETICFSIIQENGEKISYKLNRDGDVIKQEANAPALDAVLETLKNAKEEEPEMSQVLPPQTENKPTEHASTTSQPDSLFNITTPIQIKQDNEYPVLADMPKPTEDFEKFLEYMKGKHPELVERINSKIKARLNSEKTIADVVRITEKDGVYEIVIDNDSQHPITVHANGIVTYKDYFNNTSKYYPDGGEAYIEKDGKMTRHITPNFDTSLYYPENKQTDDGIVIGKIETVRKRLPDGNIRTIQELEYAQDGTLLAQYDYDQENPKKITKTIYKDGKAVEQKTYLNGYKGHPETITLIKDDGTQVKTRYIMVTNPNQGSKEGEILKAEETVLKNGVETTTTYKQKTQEFISLVEAGEFAKAEKLAEELINERWQIESFKSDRDDNMVLVEGRSVNSAWRTLDEGLDGTLTADRDIKVVKQGLEELQAIMASGGIITKKKLTPEEIIAHYTPTIQAACTELTQLIQNGASLEDIKKSDAYKKIIKYTNYPYLLSFDIPMNTTPQIAKAWKLILSGDQYYQMPDGINALKEVKKFNPIISIGIDMTQEEKDNVSLISGSTANDFVKDLSECEDINAILNSESFTRLMNIGKHLGNVDFSVGNNDGVVFAPLTVGNQTYDINWLETTYNQLEAAINNQEETTIKTILTELIKAHKFGVPIDLSGSKEYRVKYATLYTMGDDQLDDAKEKYSETTYFVWSTALSEYDDHIKKFNSYENRDQALSAIGLSSNSASDIGILARGLMEYPANSSEFATGIFIINSKEYIDKINQLLRSLGVENGNPNPLAVWCQRSGKPDLLRHLGQYDPYFKALYEGTVIRKPIEAKQ